VKAKVFPVHAMKACRRSEGMAPLILNLGDKLLASCPSHFVLAEGNLVPIEYEVVCTREQVWTF